jgi:hypothetical protein
VAVPLPWRVVVAVLQQLWVAAARELPQPGMKERSWRREMAGPPKPFAHWKRPSAPA